MCEYCNSLFPKLGTNCLIFINHHLLQHTIQITKLIEIKGNSLTYSRVISGRSPQQTGISELALIACLRKDVYMNNYKERICL